MRASTKLLLRLNTFFPPVVHPFNEGGTLSYPEWQYANGARTIEFFAARYDNTVMFDGKRVLDIGCGGAGKSLYYASKGAYVTGLEIVSHYREQAEAFADKLGLSDRFTFVEGSADAMPFADGTFDTVISNDVIEHVSQPEAVIREAMRVLRPGGRLYINFPPYYHPMGAHLTDCIHIPWVHCFFGDRTLVEAYKSLIAPLPDADMRYHLRIGTDENGREYFKYINKMTVRRFSNIVSRLPYAPEHYHVAPLRKICAPLCTIPLVRELFIKMVVAVFVKN